MTLSGLEVTAKPYQAELLEQLDAERVLHDRHRNLIVAATGTGKTVIAALDYRRLVRETHGRDLSLLFVAHRKEILTQSRRMYQEVLTDPTFGELLVDGEQPTRWRHVFASIQSLTADRLSAIEPGHFDIVVIDEFHHAQAASYHLISTCAGVRPCASATEVTVGFASSDPCPSGLHASVAMPSSACTSRSSCC